MRKKILEKEIHKKCTYKYNERNHLDFRHEINVNGLTCHCSPMVRETGVQSQIESYQGL